jgi:hypothetical protein
MVANLREFIRRTEVLVEKRRDDHATNDKFSKTFIFKIDCIDPPQIWAE